MPILKTGPMIEEYEKKRRKQVSSMRAILDYGIGVLICIFGIFLIVRDRFDLAFNESYPPDYLDKILGAVFIIYGSWRIYRGYKKNYFK